VTAMKLYRDSFRPSETLSEPHTLVSIGVVAHDDAAEARRQAHTAAMAMLRMLRRKSYKLLTPEEAEAYVPSAQEQQILDMYVRRFVNGTGEQVAEHLDHLHDMTGVDEMMLVTMGHSREVQTRPRERIADPYGLPHLGARRARSRHGGRASSAAPQRGARARRTVGGRGPRLPARRTVTSDAPPPGRVRLPRRRPRSRRGP